MQGTGGSKLTCRGGCGDRQRGQRLCAPSSGAQHGGRLHACHASVCSPTSQGFFMAWLGMASHVMSSVQGVQQRGGTRMI